MEPPHKKTRVHGPFLPRVNKGWEYFRNKPAPDQEYDIDNFILSWDVETKNKATYGIVYYYVALMLTNIQECRDIPALLKTIFKKAIDQAFEKAQTFGLEPRKFGILIDSDGLGRGSVGASIRTPEMNNLNSIFHLFYDCCQSGQNKIGDILHNLIEIHIQVVGGHHGGAGLKRKIVNGVNENCLIKISNSDGKCLFDALELSRINASLPKDTSLPEYSREHTRFSRLRRDYFEPLMEGFPTLRKYDVETYGELVQQNERTLTPFKPVYESYAPSFLYEVPIYFDRGHFYAITNIASLFGFKSYCTSCLAPYPMLVIMHQM